MIVVTDRLPGSRAPHFDVGRLYPKTITETQSNNMPLQYTTLLMTVAVGPCKDSSSPEAYH